MAVARRKVKYEGRFSSVSLDWRESVLRPAEYGYFVQAFVVADSFLDALLDTLLRQVYDGIQAQDLINRLPKRFSLGMSIAEVLKNHGILRLSKPEQFDEIKDSLMKYPGGLDWENLNLIPKGDLTLYSRIKKFKARRNSVAHSPTGEDNLVSWSDRKDCETQGNHDVLTQKEAEKWLSEGQSIFESLCELCNLVSEFKE